MRHRSQNHIFRRTRSAAFSLLELVGVLLVVAVLSAAAVPMLVREVDAAARGRELELLRQLGGGLTGAITRQGAIPGPSNWAAVASGTAGLASDDLMTNARGNPRLFLVDPRFRVGPQGTNGLPFTQTHLGTASPTNTRILLVSSLGPALPASVAGGSALAAAAFDALWNLPDRTVPGEWNWPGAGDDLILHRLELRTLFQPVILNDSAGLGGRFSVNGSSNFVVPATPFVTHLLVGSVLGLHGSDGSVQSREIVAYPASYSFEAGSWRSRLLSATEENVLVGMDLTAAAAAFSSAASAGNLTSAAVYAAMTNWLGRYTAWSAAGYPSSGPIWSALASARNALANGTATLVNDAN
jgi:type II secretory pathway pseudopilin PulG